jgi:hypothetical protein
VNGFGRSKAHLVRVGATIFAVVGSLILALPVTAGAEHPAGKAVFKEIDDYLSPSAATLEDHLASVELSDAGPYALVHEAGGQDYYAVLLRSHGHWRDLATISDQGLPCGLVPRAVVRDLHLLNYADGVSDCK